MQVVAETITEYYIMEGKREGLVEGERKGKLLGQLKALKSLSDDGVIDTTVYQSRSRVLRKQLKALQSDL